MNGQKKSLSICIAPAARGLSRSPETPSETRLRVDARMQSLSAITADYING